MKAKETAPDVSMAEDDWDRVIWTAPAGTRIRDLPTVTSLHIYDRDSDHAYRNSSSNALGYFRWMGDTDGDDICNTTTGDTHMYFYLAPFPVRLEPKP
jgi:hypothetical protein